MVATGSLSRAADAVHVSQPAASQALARLESQFGGTLVERGTGGVQVTQRGRIVAARAQRIGLLLRAAGERIARRGQGAEPKFIETHATVAHLRAITAFARSGSFSAAGRLLDHAEPTVHRAARELERIVGVPLFEGQRSAVRLSIAGRALAASAGLVLREMESALEEVREYEGRFDGRIVVGTLPLVRTRIIPRAIVEWTKTWPAANAEILDGPYEQLLAALHHGEVDVLIGALREGPLPGELTQEKLFDDGLSVIAGARHPLVGRTRVAPSELSAYGWVLPRAGTPTRAIFDRIADAFDIRISGHGLVETGSLVALRGILMETDRLSILSRRQIAQEEEAGLLGIVPVDLPDTERPIGVTTRGGWQPTRLQAGFMDVLRKAALEETSHPSVAVTEE